MNWNEHITALTSPLILLPVGFDKDVGVKLTWSKKNEFENYPMSTCIVCRGTCRSLVIKKMNVWYIVRRLYSIHPRMSYVI